jgi:DNA-binding transcriptional MocR family regulator
VAATADPVIDWDRLSTAAGRAVFGRFLGYTPETVTSESDDLINLSGLDLDHRLFPVSEVRQSLNRVLSRSGGEALGYGPAQGLAELRSTIASRARTHGIRVDPEEVLITGGSQQAIDLVLRVLTGPGDRIALEEPTYANVLPLVEYHQLDVAGVPMGARGLDLETLEKLAVDGPPALVYTIPNFQNPTGITTPQSHREALLELCERYRIPLVEDGFEEEMKYFGRVALPIKSMDARGTVIYLGTFSKVLFPGLRVGWIIADADLIQRLTALKRFADLSTSPLVQAALHDFCERGQYERHIRKVHRVFRRRMQVALDAARQHLPAERVRWTEPAGGYLIWVSFRNDRSDEPRFDAVCRDHGVAVSPGSYYFAHQPDTMHFRISISTLEEAEIERGIERLGAAVRRFVGRT